MAYKSQYFDVEIMLENIVDSGKSHNKELSVFIKTTLPNHIC